MSVGADDWPFQFADLTASMMYHPAQDWAALAHDFLAGYYGEGAFGMHRLFSQAGLESSRLSVCSAFTNATVVDGTGVQQYLDAFAGAETSAHFAMAQYDPKYDSPTGPNNATFLRDPFLTPTAILSAARGLTEAQRVISMGVLNEARKTTLLRRLDAAKMPTLLVLLYRWKELRNVSAARGQDWPLAQSTVAEAYAEWSKLYAGFRMRFGGSLDCCGNTSEFWQLIFNRTNTARSI